MNLQSISLLVFSSVGLEYSTSMTESQDNAGEKVGLEMSNIPDGDESRVYSMVNSVELAVLESCCENIGYCNSQEKYGVLALFRRNCCADSKDTSGLSESSSFQVDTMRKYCNSSDSCSYLQLGFTT